MFMLAIHSVQQISRRKEPKPSPHACSAKQCGQLFPAEAQARQELKGPYGVLREAEASELEPMSVLTQLPHQAGGAQAQP